MKDKMEQAFAEIIQKAIINVELLTKIEEMVYGVELDSRRRHAWVDLLKYYGYSETEAGKIVIKAYATVPKNLFEKSLDMFKEAEHEG